MATINKRTLKSGKVIWLLTHGTPPNRVKFKAGDTRQEAEATLAAFKRQLALHGSSPHGLTVEQAVAQYRDHLDLNRSKSTARRYGRVLQTFADCFLVTFHPGVALLRQITPRHVEDYKRRRLAAEIIEAEPAAEFAARRDQELRSKLAEKPEAATPKENAKYGYLGRKKLHTVVTKKTINYEIKTLRTFFAWCIRQNLLFLNPATSVETFRIPRQSIPKFFTATELRKFLAACQPYEHRVFSILLLTGMRRGEIEHLEWADVQFDLGAILIRGKDDWQPKTNERVIPISAELHRVLVAHAEERRSDRWVIANRAGNRETHLLEKVKKICRKAKITPAAATVHALRHSFGAHLRMAGVPLANIADLMGHADLATTQIYAKVHLGHLRDAVGTLTPLVSGMSPENVPAATSADSERPKLLSDGDLEE